MCVGHGLVSVNPKKHLIGHHLDWARGFPFEAFGLPDQYARLAPSVAIFGFGYDDDFLKVMGEPWPGVRDGRSGILADEARGSGRQTSDEVRSETAGGSTTAGSSEQAQDAEDGQAPPRAARERCARSGPGQRSGGVGAWTSARTTSGRWPRRPRSASTTWCKAGSNPMGLDVGTSKIVAAPQEGQGDRVRLRSSTPSSPSPTRASPRSILGQNDISYYRDGDELIIYGTATERFANMFNAECRRPMADGLLNPARSRPCPCSRPSSQTLVPEGPHAGRDPGLLGARGRPRARKRSSPTTRPRCAGYFEALGYRAVAINEGLAVIFSELEDQNFTGIGISCGGGMCNVTLAFLSIPSIMFSIPKGGDFIDARRGLGGRRARDAREGASRKRASTSPGRPRTSSRRRSTSTTRTSWRPWSSALRTGDLAGGEAAPDRPARCPSSSRAAPPSRRASRSCSRRRCGAHAAHRDRRGAHGLRSADRHRPRRADRRHVREVGPSRSGSPAARRPRGIPLACCASVAAVFSYC